MTSPFNPHRLKSLAATLMAVACSLSPLLAEEILVFAAASLTDVLQEAARAYPSTADDKVLFHFAGSSLLARQIQEGAPADIFFSADEAKMDQLSEANLVEHSTRKSLLSNRLVVVMPIDSSDVISSVQDLARLKRIALAEPSTVPAGIYARQYLERAGVWTSIKGAVIPTQNVRAALAAVESGNVDAAIVYQTDAKISSKVRIAFTPDISGTPPISYPVAATRSGARKPEVKKFLEHLRSEASLRIFEKHGFIVKRDDR